MLMYDNKQSCLWLILRRKGSVFPQALVWAFPCMLLALGVSYIQQQYFASYEGTHIGQIWSSFNIAIGILLVFRTQQAYGRWWEGGSVLQEMRGEWHNTASSIIAFCDTSEGRRQEVRTFQHLLVRLMSMMHCSALQQISMMGDELFDIIDTYGIDADKLQYLSSCTCRTEVLLQWVQRLIADNVKSGVLTASPPCVAGIFQGLARGHVHLNNLHKFKRYPFPFPYAQVVQLILIVHWALTPVFIGILVKNMYLASVFSFVITLAFWSINYIAVEIEMPFGNDVNDLPIIKMQDDMNTNLLLLLERRVQEYPEFDIRKSFMTKRVTRAPSLELAATPPTTAPSSWRSDLALCTRQHSATSPPPGEFDLEPDPPPELDQECGPESRPQPECDSRPRRGAERQAPPESTVPEAEEAYDDPTEPETRVSMKLAGRKPVRKQSRTEIAEQVDGVPWMHVRGDSADDHPGRLPVRHPEGAVRRFKTAPVEGCWGQAAPPQVPHPHPQPSERLHDAGGNAAPWWPLKYKLRRPLNRDDDESPA